MAEKKFQNFSEVMSLLRLQEVVCDRQNCKTRCKNVFAVANEHLRMFLYPINTYTVAVTTSQQRKSAEKNPRKTLNFDSFFTWVFEFQRPRSHVRNAVYPS